MLHFLPIVSLVAGLVVVLGFFVVATIRRDPRWGINFRRAHCANCHAAQPLVRRPRNERQAMWGGTTCPQCGAELDKWGDVVKLSGR
jgi:hypothetical protein